MAKHKSKQNPYKWHNGTWHSRPENTGRGAPKKPKPSSGTGGAQAPRAPAPAPAPRTTAPPPDPQYEAYKVTAGRNLGIANADYAYETGRAQQDYGIDDHSNPFSRAALLTEEYQRGQTTTNNSFAAQGQLYSSSNQNAHAYNTHNYAIADDQLRRQYADTMHGLQRGRLQSYADYGVGVSNAGFQSLLGSFR